MIHTAKRRKRTLKHWKKRPARKRAAPRGRKVARKRFKKGASIRGHGDYTLKQNSLLKGSVPSFGKEQAPVRITHKEYVGNVYCSTDGSIINQPYYINPGNQTLFPWLSLIAAQFDAYKFHGMVMYFKSFTTDTAVSATVSTGQIAEVIFSTDYNVSNAPFAYKQQALNMEFSESCRASKDMIHGIECSVAANVGDGQHYITLLPSPVGLKVNDDPAKFFHATFQAMTASGPVITPGTFVPARQYPAGEFWMAYDVSLYKAAPQPYLLNTQLVARAFTITATNLLPFGASCGNNNTVVSAIGAYTGSTAAAGNLPSGNFLLDFMTNVQQGGTGGDLNQAASNIVFPNALTSTGTQGVAFQFPTWITSGLFKVTIMWYGSAGATMAAYGNDASGYAGFAGPKPMLAADFLTLDKWKTMGYNWGWAPVRNHNLFGNRANTSDADYNRETSYWQSQSGLAGMKNHIVSQVIQITNPGAIYGWPLVGFNPPTGSTVCTILVEQVNFVAG